MEQVSDKVSVIFTNGHPLSSSKTEDKRTYRPLQPCWAYARAPHHHTAQALWGKWLHPSRLTAGSQRARRSERDAPQPHGTAMWYQAATVLTNIDQHTLFLFLFLFHYLFLTSPLFFSVVDCKCLRTGLVLPSSV